MLTLNDKFVNGCARAQATPEVRAVHRSTASPVAHRNRDRLPLVRRYSHPLVISPILKSTAGRCTQSDGLFISEANARRVTPTYVSKIPNRLVSDEVHSSGAACLAITTKNPLQFQRRTKNGIATANTTTNNFLMQWVRQ